MRAILGALLAMIWLSLPVVAQQQEPAPATLLADQISVTGARNDILIAEGHVEVLYGPHILRATRIEYRRAEDIILIDGPLSLVAENGDIVLADSGELSADLTAGILKSARLVLDQQLQLAAANLHRVGDRFSVLDNTVATSCTVCDGGVPLWQIRARRIIHDQEERQIYFDDARFEVAGLPVMYLPRLRLPDPTLERATGFLLPRVRASNLVGLGIEVPYFITLGDHADLTLAPFLSRRSRTLGLRYRQAFRNGEIEVNAAGTRDDILTSRNRGYLYASGDFDLPREFKLEFDLRTVSDEAYLLDYSIDSADRLASPITLSRTLRDEQITANATYYETLRSGEDSGTLPRTIVSGSWTRRFVPGPVGGIATAEFDLFAFNRPSGADTLGRDLERASARLNWHRDWTTNNGVVLGFTGALHADYFKYQDDSLRPDAIFRSAQFGAVELRWPMIRNTTGGAVDTLEPIAQLVWSQAGNRNIANEDSLAVEFDEGNLFALNRFPGSDAVEEGLRLNLGVNWTRYTQTGLSFGATLGRVIREKPSAQFDTSTGLNGYTSDWLAAVRVDTGTGLTLGNRMLFDDQLSFSQNELRVGWNSDRANFATSYLWSAADLTANQATDISEVQFDGGYRFNANWTGRLDWRYDIEQNRAAETGLGLEFRNECVVVDLSLSRRFTSSASVRPSTDFGLTVTLSGFGNSRADPVSRNCVKF
ncbi:LPS-assembly protein LptD [Actibacterium mucosum]|nr:LPS assembly protein LptD [Actibacterium mucosum]